MPGKLQEKPEPSAPPGSPLAISRPIWRVVLALALPALAQHFLILFVGLSDRFLAGHYQPVPPPQQAEALGHRLLALGLLGDATVTPGGLASVVAAEVHWEAGREIMAPQAAILAAQNTAHYLAWFLSSYMVLVNVGSTALVARCVGGRDMPGAVHFTNQSLSLAVFFGLLGTAAGAIGLQPLVALLQLHDEAAAFAVAYLRPLFLLLVFQVIEQAGIACLVGAGDTRTGLGVLGGVALINLPLSWGFCLGLGPLPALGFVGIALGTALAHVLGCLAVLWILARGRFGLHLRPRLMWPAPDLMRRLLRVGVPAGVDSLSIVVGQFWFLSIVNQLGDVASSAHGIALGWEALGFMSGAAFGTAAMTLVGQYLGAGRPAQATRSGWVAFGMGCGVMTLMGLIFFSLASPMFELFCPHAWQRPIVEAGVPVLRLVAFAMPALAAAIIFTSALRGAGDTRVPVLFTWVGFLACRIPLAYYFTSSQLDLGVLGSWSGLNLGLFGAWLAMLADLLVRGAFFLWRFAGGAWQRIRV